MHNFTIHQKNLIKLLSLDKSSAKTLQIILEQFNGNIEGKLNRKDMNDAEKQLIKRGIFNLKKDKLLVAIPKKQSLFMLNPYIFETDLNQQDKKKWDKLCGATKLSSTGFTPLPQVFTPDVLNKLHNDIRNTFSQKQLELIKNHKEKTPPPHLTLDPKIETQIKRMKRIFPDDALESLEIAIQQFFAYVKTKPQGLTFQKCYDKTLPSVRFKKELTELDKKNNYTEKVKQGRKFKENRDTKKNLLIAIDSISTRHSEYCEELKDQGKECECSDKANVKLRELLREAQDGWNVELQQFAKDWFMNHYPEKFL